MATFALTCFILLFMATYMFAVKYFASRQFRRVRRLAPALLNRKRSNFQVSPLSGTYMRETEVLDVRIFREAGKSHWTLQASAADNENVAYEGTFRTDVEAYDQLLKRA